MTWYDLSQTVRCHRRPVPPLLARGEAVHLIYLSMCSSMLVCIHPIILPPITHLYLHAFICLPTHAYSMCACVHLCIQLLMYSHIHPLSVYSHLSSHLHNHPTHFRAVICPVRLLIYPATINQPIHVFIHPLLIHQPTHSYISIDSSTYPHICVSIYPGIHLMLWVFH